MNAEIVNKIEFPEFKGIKCNMMPFIQGDSSSLPGIYKSYSEIIDQNYLEKGEIGYLSIDESFVKKGKSQRGYNSKGIERNVHIEVGTMNNKHRWGGKYNTLLEETTKVLIANNISNTCKLWDTLDKRYTNDGDLSEYITDYPENSGILLKAGELAKISIFTPHECIIQNESGKRQFFRIVGKGVTGRESYFTVNPLLN
jgi:hypothetical protein